MNEAQISDVEDDLEGTTQPLNSRRTSPFVVDELIHLFLTDEVFQSVQNAVERTVKETGEEEGTFSDRF